MEGDIKDAFIKLLSVGGHLLHARLALQVPNPELKKELIKYLLFDRWLILTSVERSPKYKMSKKSCPIIIVFSQ